MRHICYAVIAALLAPTAWAGAVYKCERPEGGFVYQGQPCAAESQSVASWQTSAGGGKDDEGKGGSTEVVLNPGRGGHYYVDGAVNGHFLNFVIDTGASVVTLPVAAATSAGLRCKEQAAINTANGTSRACVVSIEKLTFGGFTLRDVDALVAPNLSEPLLGMNVLKRFHVDQGNGQMRLSRNY